MNRSKFAEILHNTTIPGDMSEAQLNHAMVPIRQALLDLKPNKLYRYRKVNPDNIDALRSNSVYTVTADRFMTLMIHSFSTTLIPLRKS